MAVSEKRPEIQRWDCGLAEPEECGDWGDDMAVLREDETGKYILYSDHLRAVTLAKIEVLEEISDYYGHTTRDMAQAKIAALRKELEG